MHKTQAPDTLAVAVPRSSINEEEEVTGSYPVNHGTQIIHQDLFQTLHLLNA